MRSVKIFSIPVFISTCSVYWYNKTRANSRINSSYTSTVHASGHNYTLEQVQVIFRHGARTPAFLVSSDQYSNLGKAVWDRDALMKTLPWTDVDYTVKLIDGEANPEVLSVLAGQLPGGCPTGYLTTLGQQQTYDLGKWLAEEYMDHHQLITSVYKPEEIYVRSSNVKRTIHSASCVVAGMYGLENIQTPIVIHSKMLKTDDSFPNHRECAKIFTRYVHYWDNTLESMREDEVMMNASLGIQDGAQALNFIVMHDIELCRSAHGLVVPRVLKENRELLIRHSLEMMLAILGVDKIEGMRNSIGSFLNTLCNRLSEGIEGSCKEKMLLYSTHDQTILCLLKILGKYDGKHWPAFASNLVIELHRRHDGERFLRFLYNKQPLTFNNQSEDEEYMPVDVFMELAERYRVGDWAYDCGNLAQQEDCDVG